LLPAGEAALVALEMLLAGPEPVQAREPASGPLTFKWKVAAGPDPEERAVLEQLLARLPHGSRLRLDANGGWDRATAQAWAERLASDPRLDWLEQPLAPADLEGLAALAALVPVALDESLRFDPGLRERWPGWQVRRPSLEGDPRPLLQALTTGTPRLMLSTAFETGIGRRFLAHLAALQQGGPTPTAPGLAPGWRPAGALFDNDPALVWAAAGGR
jgi:O-succinylbenzoate synthase